MSKSSQLAQEIEDAVSIDFIGINGQSEMKALSVKAFENLGLKIAKSFVQQGT